MRSTIAPRRIPRPMRITSMAVDAVSRPLAKVAPFVVAKPAPGVVPKGAATMAMDDMSAVYAWAATTYAFTEGLRFPGYPYLAELAQRGEYRRIVEIIAREMTRKWIKFTAKGDAAAKADKIAAIEAAFKRLKVRPLFRRAAEKDGFFGRAHIYIDTGAPDDDGKLLPLSPRSIPEGGLKALRLVEPMWAYPTAYNSTNPLAPGWYDPAGWYIMGREVHASRLITLIGREVPDMLKPAYNFGGLSLTQIAKPYVDNWLRTRDNIADTVNSFSKDVIKTNMAGMLTGAGAENLMKRAEIYNRMRDNRGVSLIDMDTEDFVNVSTPLSGLHELQAQAQEQMASISGIPLVVLLGVTPSGLNASSDGEIRTFYAGVHAMQENLFDEPLERILALVQLSEFGEIDPEIGFEYVDLWETPALEVATLQKTQADTAAVYVGAGVLSPEEERQRLADDEASPYHGLDLADDPPPLPEDDEDIIPDDEDADPDAGGDPP